MRIPSQTVQSEDDVDKPNHEKDPIFKDDTSKGILHLLCLLSNDSEEILDIKSQRYNT